MYGVTELDMVRGDRFYLYSDGVLEIGGGRELGLSRFPGVCAGYRVFPLDQAVQGVVDELTLAAEPKDDILLMGVEV